MNGWAATRLVAEREIAERLRSRLIRVVTIATALMVVAGVTIPGLLKGSSSATRIDLVGPATQPLAPAITRTAAVAKVKISLAQVGNEADARRALTGGRLDLAVSTNAGGAQIVSEKPVSSAVHAVVQTAVEEQHLLRGLAQAGVRPAEVLPALEPVPVTTTVLHPAPPNKAARSIAALAAALLMYASLGLYGNAVATGVAQEKTSRTAEVLLGALRPGQLLTGKVLGIGSIGLGQFAIAAVAGLIANAIVHSAKIPGSVLTLLPVFIVCFLAGFLLYAFALAAAGALVARQEEVQMVGTPITMFLIIGYLLVYPAIASPDATWLKLASLLPPLTATLMPARIALGHIAWWEIPLDAALMVASIYLMVRVASQVYASALIRSGARLSWRAALQLRRQRA